MTLLRRCWRLLGHRQTTTTIHLFPETEQGCSGPFVALCGQSVPWHLRPQYQPNGCGGELLTDPAPEVESRVCRRCERYAAKRGE